MPHFGRLFLIVGAGLVLGTCSCQADQPAAPAALQSAQFAFEEFEQIFCSGAHDWERISNVPSSTLLYLMQVIESNDRRLCWENAVLGVGAVGTIEAFGFLQALIERPVHKIDMEYGRMMVRVPWALGWLAFRHRTEAGVEPIVDYLVAGADREHWKPRAPVGSAAEVFGYRNLDRAFVQGLAMTAHPRARAELLRLDPNSYPSYQRTTIAGAVVMYDTVARHGFISGLRKLSEARRD